MNTAQAFHDATVHFLDVESQLFLFATGSVRILTISSTRVVSLNAYWLDSILWLMLNSCLVANAAARC